MDAPWDSLAAPIMAYRAGCCSAIPPCQARSTSSSVHVSLNAAPAASEPIGTAYFLIRIIGRVKVDEVYRLGVHAPHDVQIVASPHRAV